MPQKLLVIIPCYNEEVALPILLSRLIDLVLPPHYQLTVAVVNDQSTDNTAAIATGYPIMLLDLPVNLGIGGAVQSGLLYASEHNFDVAVQMDGDGQHPPAELLKLLHCYEISGADVIIGSRFIERMGFQSSFLRRIGIAYFHWLNKFFTGQHIFDSTSGFRLFNKKAIELTAQYYPDEYPEPESLVILAKAGLQLKETPVVMDQRIDGRSSIRNFASLYYCIKVTIAMFFSSIRKL